MDLDFEKIRVREIVGVQNHPMKSGHYELIQKSRYSDGFIYIRSGAATYTFPDQKFRVSKGDFLYLGYGAHYNIDVECEEEYSVCYIDGYLERPAHGSFRSARFTLPEGNDVETMILRLHTRWVRGNTEIRLQAFATLYSIFACLAQEGRGYLPLDKRERMKIIRERIRERYCEPDFNCAGLAEEVGMTEITLRRLFMRMYGVTPRRFLISERMRAAREMLSGTDEDIQEIAEKTGYNSVYYFSRAFHQETGFTPTEYRKRGC